MCWTRLPATTVPAECLGHSRVIAATKRRFATPWITARILEEGKRCVCLTTDLSNRTSNALYARLGYRLIGEASMIAFDEATST
jgi:hypothetical protein